MTPLRAALIGCGSMSNQWMEAARTLPDVEMVGFADLKLELARRHARAYGVDDAVARTDYRTVMDEAQPDIVFDCTVPETHAEVTLAALERGMHVLGEKPLAHTLPHARQMIEAAERAGKLYAVIQNRRYDRNIRRLRKLIASDALGKLTTLHSDFFIGPHFGGFRDHMEHVLLLDMAIHTFDAARLISGADPVSVYCKEWNPSGSWYDHDASAVAIFEMSDGLVYTYRGSWAAEGLPTTWEGQWRAIGERGTATWDGGEDLRAQVVQERGGFFSTFGEVDFPDDIPPEKTGGHDGIIREFVNCVQNGLVPETTAADNIKSLAMVFAAIESAERGESVAITA